MKKIIILTLFIILFIIALLPPAYTILRLSTLSPCDYVYSTINYFDNELRDTALRKHTNDLGFIACAGGTTIWYPEIILALGFLGLVLSAFIFWGIIKNNYKSKRYIVILSLLILTVLIEIILAVTLISYSWI